MCASRLANSLDSVQTGGRIGNAYFAYGSAPGRQSITINFDGHLHRIPVSSHGVWAFIKIRTEPRRRGFPHPTA